MTREMGLDAQTLWERLSSRGNRVKVPWLEDKGAGGRVWQGTRYMKGVIGNKFEKVNWDPIMEGGPWAMLKKKNWTLFHRQWEHFKILAKKWLN